MNEEHILRQRVQEDIDAVKVKCDELRKKIKEARKDYDKIKHDLMHQIKINMADARRKQKAIDIYFGVYVSPALKYIKKKKKAEKTEAVAGDTTGV